MKLFKTIAILSLLLLNATANAAPEMPVYKATVDKPVAEIYDNLYKSLEDSGFYVVFEPNIGNNLSGFAKKWGEDYNRNQLTEIRSMVFCNGWYANQVSNLDPDMLGFCPLHLTLIEADGKATVLFNRPSVVSVGSPAHALLSRIEGEVIEAINTGLK